MWGNPTEKIKWQFALCGDLVIEWPYPTPLLQSAVPISRGFSIRKQDLAPLKPRVAQECICSWINPPSEYVPGAGGGSVAGCLWQDVRAVADSAALGLQGVWPGELPPAEPGHSEPPSGGHCRMAGSQVSWAAFGTEVGLHP